MVFDPDGASRFERIVALVLVGICGHIDVFVNDFVKRCKKHAKHSVLEACVDACSQEGHCIWQD